MKKSSNLHIITACAIVVTIFIRVFSDVELNLLDKITWAYFIGSIPFGLILVRFSTGQDLRKIGSGNIGATNALRTGNKSIAILTLALDLVKGFVAVKLFQNSAGPDQIYFIAGAAVIGHIYPIWLNFNGGKGVATILGVLLALDWYIASILILVWLAVAYFTKYSSLAAIIAIITLPFLAFFFEGYDFAVFALTLTLIIIYKHKENIKRLMSGEESTIGNSSKKNKRKKR